MVSSGSSLSSSPTPSVAPTTSIAPSTGYRFHVFLTPVWINHAWKTLIFEPPRSCSLVDSDHCTYRLTKALGLASVDSSSRAVLLSLGKKVDTFIMDVARMRPLQKKLNQGDGIPSGSDGHFVLAGLICCILLDRMLWVLDVNVPHKHYQNRDIAHRVDDTRVRTYKNPLRTIENVRVVIGVEKTLQALQMPFQPRNDTNVDNLTSSYIGLTFGAWHKSQSDLHAIMSNCCFAAVACIGSLRVCDQLIVFSSSMN